MNLVTKTWASLATATALSKSVTSLSVTALLMATQGLLIVSTASAETLARASGRCKLTSDDYQAFDGYCTVKQKQRGGTTLFVVQLDDGSHYRFYGPNKQALQVETHDGIHNVQFNDRGDKGVFIWQEDGDRNRLSIKLDTQHDPDVSHDDSDSTSLETVVGTAVGALIGSLLTGGQSSQSTATKVQVGQSVPALEDLVDARAGQAENAISERGYVFIEANQQADSAYSNWRESKTGNCVAIRTTDGRYAAIVYAPKEDCDR